MLSVPGQGKTIALQIKKVLEYFNKHKNDFIPIYLPTASPEFMVLEEIWHIGKNDSACLTVLFIFYRFEK